MWGAKAQETLETTSYTSICYFTCAVTAFPIALFGGYQILGFPSQEWWLLLALILGHSMFNSVLKRVSPAVVSLIVFFEVPVAALLAKIFTIGNQPSGLIIPGVILILVGCSLVVLRTRPTKQIVEAMVNE